MVSKSKDGEYIAQVMQRLGLIPVRGSTSKGGDQALREMINLLETGHQVGFTPDGPRGPLHTVHGGVVFAAQNTNVPVVPTTYIATRKVTFRSWDRFILPLPFGRVLVAHGMPFQISPEMPAELARQTIQDALNDNERQADTVFEQAPSWFGEFFSSIVFGLYGLVAIIMAPLIALIVSIEFGLQRGLKFIDERFCAPTRSAMAPLWFHSSSVGEWQALKPVLRELKKIWTSMPPVMITVSTPEARLLVAKEEPTATVRLLPVDVPWLMNHWMRRVNPRALVLVETEIWPAMIRAASHRDIPITVINGRLSERSTRRWLKVKPLIQHLMFKITMVFARGPEDAARFAQLGVVKTRVSGVGNTKIDNVDVQATAPIFTSKVPVLIGGSTWPGEEAMLISLISELTPIQARLILAPRRLERVMEIRELIEKHGLSYSLYSEMKEKPVWDSAVLLVDTLGDLKKLYSSAHVAFVGGSVFPHGGQNPLEPAAAAVPTVFGPSMSNFRDEARGLLDAKAAFQEADEAGVCSRLKQLLTSASERVLLGAAASAFIDHQRGASLRVARRLCELLGKT